MTERYYKAGVVTTQCYAFKKALHGVFMEPQMVELGVTGGVIYMVLKLALEAINSWKQQKSSCLQREQFEEFLKAFEAKDKHLVVVITRLEQAVEAQTRAIEAITKPK